MTAKNKIEKRAHRRLTLLAMVSVTASGAFLYGAHRPDSFPFTFVQEQIATLQATDLVKSIKSQIAGLAPSHGSEGPELAVTAEGPPPGVSADTLEVPEKPIGAPVAASIPRAEPVPEMSVTLAEAVSGKEEKEGMASYVLGGEGMTPEVRRAWETLERARAAGNIETPTSPDDAFFRRAAGEIGYVPAGMSSTLVRSLRTPVKEGPSSLSGKPEFITADTILLDDILIKLQGAAAPGAGDLCETAEGESYDCASWAKRGMEAILAERTVLCEVTDVLHGEEGALVGWCDLTLKNGKRRDLGDIGVLSGVLRVDEKGHGISPYLRTEMDARKAGNGIWSGRYVSEKNRKENH